MVLFLVAICVVTVGCAGHTAPKAPGPPGTAKVGWVIMSGDRENPDREFVCQSEPRNECVMPASRPGDQVFSEVHVYYHPATMLTKYTGTVRIAFFEGTPYASQQNITVDPSGPVGNSSTVGIVTAKPRTYAVNIAVTATPANGRAVQLRDEIPVTVK